MLERYLKWVVFSVAVLFLAACSSSAINKTHDMVEFDGGDYQLIVKDRLEQPILEVNMQYMGMEPQGEFDFKTIDYMDNESRCSFFDCEMVNISSEPIRFVKLEQYTKNEAVVQLHSSKGVSGRGTVLTTGLEDRWGKDHILAPGDSRIFRNLSLCKRGKDILHRIYTIECGGFEYRFDVIQSNNI